MKAVARVALVLVGVAFLVSALLAVVVTGALVVEIVRGWWG